MQSRDDEEEEKGEIGQEEGRGRGRAAGAIPVSIDSVDARRFLKGSEWRTELRRSASEMVCCARVIVAVVGPWIVLKKVYGE